MFILNSGPVLSDLSDSWASSSEGCSLAVFKGGMEMVGIFISVISGLGIAKAGIR